MNRVVLFIFLLSGCIPKWQYYSFNTKDLDKDGIRDDIQNYIESEFKEENITNTFRKYSYFRWVLTTENLSEEDFVKNWDRMDRLSWCIWFLSKGYHFDYIDTLSSLNDRHINTSENIDKWKKVLSRASKMNLKTKDYSFKTIITKPSFFCLMKLDNEVKLIEKVRANAKEYL